MAPLWENQNQCLLNSLLWIIFFKKMLSSIHKLQFFFSDLCPTLGHWANHIISNLIIKSKKTIMILQNIQMLHSLPKSVNPDITKSYYVTTVELEIVPISFLWGGVSESISSSSLANFLSTLTRQQLFEVLDYTFSDWVGDEKRRTWAANERNGAMRVDSPLEIF